MNIHKKVYTFNNHNELNNHNTTQNIFDFNNHNELNNQLELNNQFKLNNLSKLNNQNSQSKLNNLSKLNNQSKLNNIINTPIISQNIFDYSYNNNNLQKNNINIKLLIKDNEYCDIFYLEFIEEQSILENWFNIINIHTNFIDTNINININNKNDINEIINNNLYINNITSEYRNNCIKSQFDDNFNLLINNIKHIINFSNLKFKINTIKQEFINIKNITNNININNKPFYNISTNIINNNKTDNIKDNIKIEDYIFKKSINYNEIKSNEIKPIDYNNKYFNIINDIGENLINDIGKNLKENIKNILVFNNDYLISFIIKNPTINELKILNNKKHGFELYYEFNLNKNNDQIIKKIFDKITFDNKQDFIEELKTLELIIKQNTKENKFIIEKKKIIDFININYKITNNIKDKIKANELFKIITNSSNTLNKEDIGLRNRLSNYLLELGLQKKRFSDGFYYYGIIKKFNININLQNTNILEDIINKRQNELEDINKNKNELVNLNNK
jgi:hypothetical protein